MKIRALREVACTAAAIALMGIAPAALGSDAKVLEGLVAEFLAAAHQRSAHERFWADDLVYTSSSGLRFGKAEIMAGFADESAGEAVPPETIYTGEDVVVRVYGDAAVVTFKLVGTPAGSSGANVINHYFNTGTFVRRDGTWKVVAWQATKIPPGD